MRLTHPCKPRRPHHCSTSGFTYVELVLVALLGMVLSAGILVVFEAGSNVVAAVNGQGTLQMTLTNVMNVLAADVHIAVATPGGAARRWW